MTEAAPVEEAVHRALIERLEQPAIAALLRRRDGAFIPGCFIGLLGFEDGDRDGAAAECCAELVRRGLPLFVRPIEAGGLLIALFACCLCESGDGKQETSVGCAVVLPAPRHVGAREPPSICEQLFHESPGRFIVCLPADKQTDARLVASEHGVPLWPLGRTGGRELVVRASDAASSFPGAPGFKEVVRLPIAALRSAPRDGSS
jgi:hypothetical protein